MAQEMFEWISHERESRPRKRCQNDVNVAINVLQLGRKCRDNITVYTYSDKCNKNPLGM